MPFPTIDGITFEQDAATLVEHIRPSSPQNVLDALARTFQRVDIVATRLYDDVQELKAWRAKNDPTYVAPDPQSPADAPK